MPTESFSLPDDFQLAPLLAFYQRDRLQLSERVTGQQLEKAFMHQGQPCWLRLDFADPGRARVAWQGVEPERAVSLAKHLCGQNQDITGLEQLASQASLSALLSRQRGLRVAQLVTPFEALVWAILGQQISVAAAHALRRRLLDNAAPRHHSGLLCFPDARRIASLSEQQLGGCGLSRSKVQTLQVVANANIDDALLPDRSRLADMEALQQRLLGIRGLGPWTVNYTLLRGYGYLDGSLHGDVVVRRGIQQLLGQSAPVTPVQAQQWLAAYRPWRALLAAHLWQAQSLAA